MHFGIMKVPFFTRSFYLNLCDCFLFPKNKNTSLNIFQISAVTVLVCCVIPFESWGQRAPLLGCSTLCHGSVMKSSRHKMAPVTLVLVCCILHVYKKNTKYFTTCGLIITPYLQLWWGFQASVWPQSKTRSLWLQSLSLFRCELATLYTTHYWLS